MLQVKFFRLKNGTEPVKDWIKSLDSTNRKSEYCEDWRDFIRIILVITNKLDLIYTNYDCFLEEDTAFITLQNITQL